MKVQLKTLMAGPNGVIAAGQVVELPEAEAQALTAGGYAVSAETISLTPVSEPASEAEESEPESEKLAARRSRK